MSSLIRTAIAALALLCLSPTLASAQVVLPDQDSAKGFVEELATRAKAFESAAISIEVQGRALGPDDDRKLGWYKSRAAVLRKVEAALRPYAEGRALELTSELQGLIAQAQAILAGPGEVPKDGGAGLELGAPDDLGGAIGETMKEAAADREQLELARAQEAAAFERVEIEAHLRTLEETIARIAAERKDLVNESELRYVFTDLRGAEQKVAEAELQVAEQREAVARQKDSMRSLGKDAEGSSGWYRARAALAKGEHELALRELLLNRARIELNSVRLRYLNLEKSMTAKRLAESAPAAEKAPASKP